MHEQGARRPAARATAAPRRQLLSSRWTSFYTNVFPVLWIGCGALGLAAFPDGAVGGITLPLVAVWLAVSVFLVWLATALRTVALDGGVLEVSSRRQTRRFAFRDVESVSGTILLSPDLIFVRFRRPTPFGSRIVFIPRQRSFRLLSRHPLVGRLSSLTLQNQAPGLPPPIEDARRPRSARRGLAVGALVVGLAFALVAGVVTSVLNSVGPYTAALERAASHPALVAELGQPIRAGWGLSGRVQVDDAAGSAELAIPLSGPRGEAVLHARARLADDEWTFQELRAMLRDGRELDLLEHGRAPDEPVGELL